MKRQVPERERGAALLAVLLLVAITGALAAAGIEKLRLSRTLAMNVAAAEHARGFASGIEQLALLAIGDMIEDSPDKTTLAGGWNGATRRVPLPGGGAAEARVRDGSHCFNLNSLVQGEPATGLSRRHSGVEQFVGLMTARAVPEADARRVAEAAVDWLDSDTVPGPAGAEDPAYASPGRGGRTTNTLFAEASELRAVIGVSPALYDRIRPWICALPTTDLSPINVNTLSADDAVLLAMLMPGRMSIDQARRVIAVRPASGWGNLVDFWRTERISELDPPLDVQLQPQIKTVWFRMETRVATEGAELIQTALIDARLGRPRLVVRRWGPED